MEQQLPKLFSEHDILNCAGELVDLDTPTVMGILNITPDSFFDGGKWSSHEAVERRITEMINDGATFIDVGAMSSRPGADLISAEEEINRLKPYENVFKSYANQVILSIDTIHSQTAEYAINQGFRIVNDISAGTFDPTILEVTSRHRLPFIAMHMKGTPTEVVRNPTYEDITTEVMSFLIDRLRVCREADIYDVVFDPGFGFGKTVEQNYTLLRELDSFEILEIPILVGISRKSMIYKPLNISPDEALPATSALHLEALQKGAKILRVHDVTEAMQTITLFNKMNGG